jgi:protein TonB
MLSVVVLIAALAAPQAAEGQKPSTIQRPDWVTQASADDLVRAYPLSAIPRQLEDNLKVRCIVKADGAMSKCKVIEDEQQGAGFDDAALGLTRLYRMPATAPDGRPVTGAVVIIPFHFMYDRPKLGAGAR